MGLQLRIQKHRRLHNVKRDVGFCVLHREWKINKRRDDNDDDTRNQGDRNCGFENSGPHSLCEASSTNLVASRVADSYSCI